MKFKLKCFRSKYMLDYWLIMITPVIDTINGLYILKYGATGFSIGTIYRLLLLIYVISRISNKKTLLIQFLPLLYFPIIGLSRGENNLFGCFTYATKWILPITLILYYGLAKNDKNEIEKCLKKSIGFWCKFVPLSLIIEYLLDLGELSYYDAGFKGLYYSTNDIALVLIVCFIYVLWETINIDIHNVVWCIAGFIAIMILSTKSSIIFALISLVYILIISKKIKIRHIVSISVILFVVWKIANIGTQFSDIMIRYSTMWQGTLGNKWLDRLLIFATSGRTSRIPTYFSEIYKHGILIINFLFGWITPDNAHVIEMDWHDLLCQYGISGFLICLCEYGYLLMKCKSKAQPYFYIVIVCLIYSILAGHVISGAFSGTAFALVFSLLLLESRKSYNVGGNGENCNTQKRV